MVAIETNMLKNRLVKHHGVVFPTPNSPNRHDDHSAKYLGQAPNLGAKLLRALKSRSYLDMSFQLLEATQGSEVALPVGLRQEVVLMLLVMGKKPPANGNLAGEYEVVTIWKPMDEMS